MKKELYVVLDSIRSLHNVGSIFRTADAAGVKKIYLCGQTGYPPRKEIAKTAIGAEEVVPWEYYINVDDCIADLKRQGVDIVALEQDPTSVLYSNFKPKKSVALVLGNEIEGVTKDILKNCEAILEIPMKGAKGSLNVSVAFGVAIYQLAQ